METRSYNSVLAITGLIMISLTMSFGCRIYDSESDENHPLEHKQHKNQRLEYELNEALEELEDVKNNFAAYRLQKSKKITRLKQTVEERELRLARLQRKLETSSVQLSHSLKNKELILQRLERYEKKIAELEKKIENTR